MSGKAVRVAVESRGGDLRYNRARQRALRAANLSATPREVKSRRIFIVSLTLLSIFAVALNAAAPGDRSISPSGQFIVYGGDAHWRGAISKLAEETKANLLATLERRDQWTTPAVINLQSPAPNLPEAPKRALHFSQTGAGLKLQLDLAISREMNWAALEREILRVILLEMIYHNQTGIAPGENYVEPPEWLIEGLLAVAPNRGRAALVNALTVSEQVTPLNEFLNQRPDLLDPVGQSVYRAYSVALVQLLAENPARLGRYIDTLAFASNDPLADLQKSFPQLKGGDLEKTWKTKIASVKGSGRTDLLSFSQSSEKLDALLGTLSLDELCQKKLTSAQKLALNKFGEELLLLAARANPALRPIVQEYHQLVAQLALGKNHGVAARLGDLKILRTRLIARMAEIDDYMNWFEATQLQTSSGLFENLVNVSAELPRPHRRDAFSAYLDAMESNF